MRITKAPYLADILRDGRSHSKVWHWIVQKEGSHEILGMGQESTLDDARQCAKECMRELARRNVSVSRAMG